MLAATITGYSGQKPEPTPPEIGSLKFYRKSWDKEGWTKFTEIKTRPCKRSDFNYGAKSSAEATFYETMSSTHHLDKYLDSMLCPAELDDFYCYGNFQQSDGSNLMIVFEECNAEIQSSVKCASKGEIDEWLKYKYIVTVENEKDFI